jgi:DNA processing protein
MTTIAEAPTASPANRTPLAGWTAETVRLLLCGGAPNARAKHIITSLSFDDYFKANDEELRERGLSRYELGSDELSEDVTALLLGTPEYPAALSLLRTAPVLLFVRGNLAALTVGVGIVGTRAISALGRATVPAAVAAAVRLKVPVHSGLALGVDALAHQLALDAGLLTCAVLATHPTNPSPSANVALATSILEHGGALVSEQRSDVTTPAGPNLMARNRVIAGLSSVVVPAEAGLPSGTLYTVAAALENDRPLVVPVPKNAARKWPGARGLLALTGNAPLTAKDLHVTKDCWAEVERRGWVANAAPESPEALTEMICLAHWFSPVTQKA